jgi:hypothetical protein
MVMNMIVVLLGGCWWVPRRVRAVQLGFAMNISAGLDFFCPRWRGVSRRDNCPEMPQLQMALTGVPTEELRQLLRLVHRRQLETPITPAGLALVGLQHRSEEIMQTLRGLDEPGVRAVLVAVVAERIEVRAGS